MNPYRDIPSLEHLNIKEFIKEHPIAVCTYVIIVGGVLISLLF